MFLQLFSPYNSIACYRNASSCLSHFPVLNYVVLVISYEIIAMLLMRLSMSFYVVPYSVWYWVFKRFGRLLSIIYRMYILNNYIKIKNLNLYSCNLVSNSSSQTGTSRTFKTSRTSPDTATRSSWGTWIRPSSQMFCSSTFRNITRWRSFTPIIRRKSSIGATHLLPSVRRKTSKKH